MLAKHFLSAALTVGSVWFLANYLSTDDSALEWIVRIWLVILAFHVLRVCFSMIDKLGTKPGKESQLA